MKTSNKVLCIGECMVELSPAETGLWQQGFAGDTMNTAWYLRQLFDESWNVEYFTALGQDRLSDEMYAFLQRAGFAIDHIVRIADRQPGLYAIHLQDGERSFSYWRENSAARLLAADPDILQQVMTEQNVIYFSGITLAILPPKDRDTFLRLIGNCRKNGQQVIFDPNLRPKLWKTHNEMCDAIERAAALSNLVMPSFSDEQDAFGDYSPFDTAHRYLALGCEEVVVKNADSEIIHRALDTAETRFAPKKVKPIDTTGAGDSFNAGFIYAKCSGKSLDDAVSLAHNVAGHVIQKRGAIVELPKLVTAERS
ncbi:sugar kinase [Thalassospira sp. ER-Se-21-Dark]|uniref:sugar kinase n=1 Tax=Thalassospira sp. ER-Se-21-Dark TaxID=2585190 RepID=UPI001B310F81|nr:sugar kinase [Thalassospira sp. ER-Se-21-Dark]MBP3124687.1 sugar kinase [Thalassospira sp. ER-Se-21-Dark]